jgi:hypothetical protein
MDDLYSKLVGVWSHGVIHAYYGGSHDFRLVLMPDGIGSYRHDGWWVYRYALFHWDLIDGNILRFNRQRNRINGFMERNSPKRIEIENKPVLLDFDNSHSLERLVVPLKSEPNDFYLLSRDPTDMASELHTEYLHAGE